MVRAGWRLAIATAALGVIGGCVFHDGRADSYRCGSGGACPDELECVDGICVSAAVADAGTDARVSDGSTDGEPDTDGPEDGPVQEDGSSQDDGPQQEDGSSQNDGPQQDAAPGCVFDPLTDDAGHFTAVLTGTSWQVGTSGYRQNSTDDLHDTWVAASGGDQVSIQAQVTLTAQGQARFNQPGGNFASAAGVIVRASSLSTTSVTGYFCGVDLRGQRLLLGRMNMAGTYSSGRGVFTVLGSQNMTLGLNTPYPVRAEARGSTITCTSDATQVSATDNSIASGSVGLFTIGARARFTAADYCVP
jgi:hypothetical protein